MYAKFVKIKYYEQEITLLVPCSPTTSHDELKELAKTMLLNMVNNPKTKYEVLY